MNNAGPSASDISRFYFDIRKFKTEKHYDRSTNAQPENQVSAPEEYACGTSSRKSRNRKNNLFVFFRKTDDSTAGGGKIVRF